LDDITDEFLSDKTNNSTLRQLVPGASAQIKVLGDTQEVQAFVFATSNQEPLFLGEKPEDAKEDWAKQANAWRRRFLCVKMDTVAELPVCLVNWNHDSAKRAAAALYMASLDALPNDVKMYIERYSAAIEATLVDGWDNEMAAVADIVMERSTIPDDEPVEPVNAFERMKQAQKRKAEPVAGPSKQKSAKVAASSKAKGYQERSKCPNECYMEHKHDYADPAFAAWQEEMNADSN
jgi:hypothetical protein